MKPRKPKGIPIHFNASQSGDSSRALAERALKTGQLPPSLQPVAIPRRGAPPPSGKPRFVRMNRPVDEGQSSASGGPSTAAASSSSSSRLVAAAAQGAAASGSGPVPSREGPPPAAPRPGSSSSEPADGAQRPPARVPGPTEAVPSQPAAAREPLYPGGPSKLQPQALPPATQSRPPPTSALPPPHASVGPGSSSSSSSRSAATSQPALPVPARPAAPAQVVRPPVAARPLYPPLPTTLPPRPTMPGSFWSTTPANVPYRPVAPGPKAAPSPSFPPVRRDSQPQQASALGATPLAAPAAAGPSTSVRSPVHDAVPLAEHEALLDRSGPSSVGGPSSRRQSGTEARSGATSGALERDEEGRAQSKGKGRELAECAPDRVEPAAAQPVQMPAAVPTHPQTASANDRRADAPSLADPHASTLAPSEPPSLPPPPALSAGEVEETSKSDNSSDDDSDVEAALAEAQRKLNELQERKRKKALRKSLGTSPLAGEASQSPAPAPVPPSPSVAADASGALANRTATPSTLAPPSPTKSSPLKPAPVVAEEPAQPSPPAAPPVEEVSEVEPLPMEVDAPQPFGTKSQVVFLDLPAGMSELSLRRWIAGTTVSVTLVDFQESYALVTFNNEFDASEVVRLLSVAEYTPGVRLMMDLASNLELVETPDEVGDRPMSAHAVEHELQEPTAGETYASPERAYLPPAHASPDVSHAARPSQPQPPSPHNSLFSSQRNSPPPSRTDSNPPPRPSTVPSGDDAPAWAAKKRRRVSSPAPAPPAVRVKQEMDDVVDLTLDSDDDQEPSPPPPPPLPAADPPVKTERTKLKYTAPKFGFENVVELTKEPRPPGSKSRWIAASDRLYACSFHKGAVEFFEKGSRKRLPPVRFDMSGESESIEGITFAGDRLIVGRAHRKDAPTDGQLPPQISWVSAKSVRKNRANAIVQGTLSDHVHASTGVACITSLPSTALNPTEPATTSVFATGGYDHAVKLWKFDQRGNRKLWPLHQNEHTSRVDSLVWDDQKKWLYSGGADGRICAFALGAGKMSHWVLPRSSTGVFQLHVSPAHPAMVLAETNRQHEQFSLYDTRQAVNHPPAMFGESAPKNDKAAGGKGRTTRYTRGSWQDSVFAVASDGALRIWDVRNLKVHQTITLHPRGTQSRHVLLDGDELVDFTSEGLFVRKWRSLS